jgi:hypothetical protein
MQEMTSLLNEILITSIYEIMETQNNLPDTFLCNKHQNKIKTENIIFGLKTNLKVKLCKG